MLAALPIKSGVLPHDPRQRFSQPRFKVGHSQSREQQLCGVHAPAPLEVCKSGIAQGSERVRDRLRVARRSLPRLNRQFGGGTLKSRWTFRASGLDSARRPFSSKDR